MTRNQKGFLGWSLLTAVLTIVSYLIFGSQGAKVIVLPFLVCFLGNLGRELKQAKDNHIFEWDDFIGYSLVIMATSVLMGFGGVLIGIIE